MLTFWQKHEVFQSLHTAQTDNTFQLKPGNQLDLKTLLVIISYQLELKALLVIISLFT